MAYPQPRKKNRTNLVAVLVIAFVLVAGGVVAIIVTTSGDGDSSAGTSTSTQDNPDAKPAAERDSAVRDGTTIADTFSTVDYTSADQDLRSWESYATGDLLTELKANHDQSVTAIEHAKSKSDGEVLSAALAEFDQDKGTARLLAAVKVDVTVQGQESSTKRQRMSVTLKKTDDGWKASAITAE
jgi:Mce-associated membrane protein